MFNELHVNNIALPKPEGDLTFTSAKIKTEYETEAGTTQVSVRRESKLTITGEWVLTGVWIDQFREWAQTDTVVVKCFFPSANEMSEHICQLSIDPETHPRNAREQLGGGGLYKISVKMEEL